MNEQELTPWFPIATKPAREGVYEVLINDSENSPFDGYLSYWDGLKFNFVVLRGGQTAIGHAANAKAMARCVTHATFDKWRGLAKKP